MRVQFPANIPDASLRFAVIAARFAGKWIFCKHKHRDTWEIPGGHREPGESIDQTARRELMEETAATDFVLHPICSYSVQAEGGEETFGKLYFAEIRALAPDLHSEIERIELRKALPEALTYPQIQPALHRRVEAFLAENFILPEVFAMNEKTPQRAAEILTQRFGHDTLIALATADGTTPWVRTVNSYYEAGSFYVITYALSNKMRHIAKNPTVALSGDWFTAHAIGENLGHILAPENARLAEALRTAFASWYANGHTNEADPNTVILRLRLTDGILFDHGTRFDLKFSPDGEISVQ